MNLSPLVYVEKLTIDINRCTSFFVIFTITLYFIYSLKQL